MYYFTRVVKGLIILLKEHGGIMAQASVAKFLLSARAVEQFPRPLDFEAAFFGRSNVGKSSLVNMLSGKTHIAKVSQTPGKTQLINLFEINEQWIIADLPGYGYAKTSRVNRTAWGKMVTNYLLQRENLVLLFVLIDSRLPAQKIDLDFMEFCGKKQIPFSIIYTKSDKSSTNQLKKQIAEIQKELLRHWNALPDQFISSSQNKSGRDEILDYIYGINEEIVRK